MTLEADNHMLEAMRSRNLVDFGHPPPIPVREESNLPKRGVALEIQGKPILAARRGTCGLCRKQIWEGNDDEMGDEIVRVAGHGWCHVFCLPDPKEEEELVTSGVGWPE